MADLVVAEHRGAPSLEELHVQRLPLPLAEINAFTITGRAVASHLLFLLFAIASVSYSVFAFFSVIRARIRHRWIWALVALIGVGKLGMYWNTGALHYSALAVQFLSFGAFREGNIYGQWVVTLSLPIGAVVAMRKKVATKPKDDESRHQI